MKSYLYYHTELEGLSDVLETIKTVEKIAASSILLLESRIKQLKLFTEQIVSLHSRLGQLTKHVSNHPFLKQNAGEGKLLLVITGSKGFVGLLWRSLVDEYAMVQDEYSHVVVLGSKGKKYFDEAHIQVDEYFDLPDMVSFEGEWRTLLDYSFSKYSSNEFSGIDLLYPQLISLSEQVPAIEHFLPFAPSLVSEAGSMESGSSPLQLPIIEPSVAAYDNSLINKYISAYFYKKLLETHLSELSARTITMEHAGKKTEKIVKTLHLRYRKERRIHETQNLLENFGTRKLL